MTSKELEGAVARALEPIKERLLHPERFDYHGRRIIGAAAKQGVPLEPRHRMSSHLGLMLALGRYKLDLMKEIKEDPESIADAKANMDAEVAEAIKATNKEFGMDKPASCGEPPPGAGDFTPCSICGKPWGSHAISRYGDKVIGCATIGNAEAPCKGICIGSNAIADVTNSIGVPADAVATFDGCEHAGADEFSHAPRIQVSIDGKTWREANPYDYYDPAVYPFRREIAK